MLDKLIKFSIKNKLFIALLTLGLIIWGTWSALHLNVDAVPDITNNQVQIITNCPSLASQEVEQLVSFPIEQSIATLPDLEETRSISRFGLSVITVVFKENVDIYFARQLILERLNEAKENIPKGIGQPELAPISTGLGEVYQYILHPKKGSENKYNAKDLRSMQDWIVARQLYGTEGIAEVNSFGGALKQYEVALNPYKLKALGVSISDVFNALEKNNENTGGAYIDKKPKAYFIRGIGLVRNIEDIKNIAVKNNLGAVPIFIKDIATVDYGAAIRYGAMTYNGEKDVVGGIVMMLKGANSNDVIKRIKEKLPIIQKSLPEDIIVEPFLDRSHLVDRAIATVEKNLVEGALIVLLVLVFFLGNLRAGLIVASAIPLALLFALAMMKIFGVSANLMSLGAIDFGLIVDGAVIIVEATLHHLNKNKNKYISQQGSISQAQMDNEVFHAASKIRHSAAFGEIIILIVYIPILTLQGIEGKMFIPMAQTVSFAILGALILSLTYIPMMSALCLSKKIKTQASFSDRFISKLQSVYEPLLLKSLKLKRAIMIISVLLLGFSIWMFKNMGGEFIPQLQEGDFAFHCILPQGSSLSQSIETSMQASRIIKQMDEVKLVVGKTGSAEVPTDPMPPEATDLIIVLKPKSEWKEKKSYQELSNEILEKLSDIPGIFFEANQPIQMRFNELMTGVRQDVAIKIFGENLDSLQKYAQQVNEVIQTVQGVSSPQIERVSGLPQINIAFDRTRLANYGLDVSSVNDMISTAFAGKVSGQVYENERRFDLVVRLDSIHRNSIEDVKNLMIPIASGNQIPLAQVANIGYKLGPAQISRESSKRRIVIGFNVQNRDVKNVVHDIEQLLAQKIKLPVGYYYNYGGQFENLQKASNRLMIAVPVALALILLLLYVTFKSMKQVILIFTAIPMSAIGGILALSLRGMPFSISAGVGFIALFGVAVLNGIVLIGTFNQLEKEGNINPIERILLGTKERLRPVLMTAMVASFGFLPMAVSTSAGAEVQKPLATVVIGGLVSATLLTLFVLPLLYTIFNQKIKINKVGMSLLCLCLLFSTQVSNAQQIELSNAQEALKIALENNAQLKVLDYEIKGAKALRASAWELPKTNLLLQQGQYNSINQDRAYQLSQNIPFPTLFSAKNALLKASLQNEKLQKENGINTLKLAVRNTFNQIMYLNENQKKLRELDSFYKTFITIAQIRYQSGDIKKVEINTAEAKAGELQIQFQQNSVALKSEIQNLQALLNTTDAISITPSSKLEILAFDTTNIQQTFDTHPIVQQLKQEQIMLQKNKTVEWAQSLPEFTIGYTNQSLIGYQTINNQDQYFGANYRFYYTNIGISVPLTFFSNAAKIKSYTYKSEAAAARKHQTLLDLKASYENQLRQYAQNINEVNYYKANALPNAKTILNAAQLAYKSGEIGYVEYLYALQTSIDIELNYLKSIAQLNQIIIQLYYFSNQ